MKRFSILRGAAVLSAAALLSLASASQAALSYTVTVDVSSLVGNANGPFSLDVELASGSGNVANSVTLSNFQVTGGSFTGSAFTLGSTSGSFGGTLTLGDSSAYNEFAQAFTAGTTKITFDVTQTTNSETVGTGTPFPDQFNVFLDDNNTADGLVPTTDPSGANTLLASTIANGETLSNVKLYTSVSPDGGVTISASALAPVPEPATALFGAAVFGACTLRRRRNS